MIVGKKLIIKGRVQGVWYRASAQNEARSLGLCGFALNQPDGCVCVEVEGEQKAVESFVKWCGVGPQFAKVSNIVVEDQEIKGFEEFEIRRPNC